MLHAGATIAALRCLACISREIACTAMSLRKLYGSRMTLRPPRSDSVSHSAKTWAGGNGGWKGGRGLLH